jgi:Chlorophyll A-B binding protein
LEILTNSLCRNLHTLNICSAFIHLQVYTINYDADKDIVIIKDLVNRFVYDAEVGAKDNRISLIWETATPLAGPPSFQQLQMILKGDAPGPEIINGRVAMAAFLGIAVVELISGQTAISTLATPAGAVSAITLALLTTAASIAPALTGNVSIDKVLPNTNDSYPDQQLPYYFSPLAESINGRVAMIGVAALLINEAIRGAAVF